MMGKSLAVTGLTVMLGLSLAGCASTPGAVTAVSSSSVSTVAPAPAVDAVKVLKDALGKSISDFSSTGGSESVHVETNGVVTTNVVAVNPSIYNGMVRLTIGEDGKVSAPRADANVYTQLNLVNDLLAKGSEGLNLKTVGDVVTYDGDGYSNTVYLIDGKVTKIVSIVSNSADTSKPSKVTYVYAYGDTSYNEAIKIISEAVAASKG